MIGVAFMIGLLGSLHCIGMCGPLAMVANRIGKGQEVVNALVYNLSRIGVYVLLGVSFGMLGQIVVVNGLQKWLSVVLGLAIALLAITLVINPKVNNYLTGQFGFAFKWLSRLNHPGQKGTRATVAVGIINGFLPCGLVYMALAGAVVQNSLVDSATFMMAFGLGTLPLMFSLSLSGNKLFQLIKGNYRRVLSIGLFAFGLFLVYRGLGMEFTSALSNIFNPTAGVAGCK